MANDSTSGGSSNGLLYGIIGALGAVVVGGGLYMYKLDNWRSLPCKQQSLPPLRLRLSLRPLL